MRIRYAVELDYDSVVGAWSSVLADDRHIASCGDTIPEALRMLAEAIECYEDEKEGN